MEFFLFQKFKTEGVHFSVNDFIIKAVGTALSASPEVWYTSIFDHL